MKIRDIMTRDVTTIHLETPILEAAKEMRSRDIGALPVTDGQKIRGMLTDRDIVTRAVALGKDLAKTPASEAMTEHIKYVFEDDETESLADKMKDRQIRRLVVLSRDKRLVGFVSMGDLARKGQDERLTAGVAKCCAEPADAHAAH